MRHLLVVAAAGFVGSASSAQTHPSAPESTGIQCTRLNANGSASGEAVLTVNVNGQDVGTFDAGVYSNLEDFMTPGSNTITLTFSAPDAMVNGELRCLRPGQTSSRKHHP